MKRKPDLKNRVAPGVEGVVVAVAIDTYAKSGVAAFDDRKAA